MSSKEYDLLRNALNDYRWYSTGSGQQILEHNFVLELLQAPMIHTEKTMKPSKKRYKGPRV